MAPEESIVARVWEALRTVVDPELDCNIVDLGLVYGVEVRSGRCEIRMTLTTQGCPMHESLIAGVEYAAYGTGGIEQVQVELVWDPPWHPAMMSSAAREQLGLFEQ